MNFNFRNIQISDSEEGCWFTAKICDIEGNTMFSAGGETIQEALDRLIVTIEAGKAYLDKYISRARAMQR